MKETRGNDFLLAIGVFAIVMSVFTMSQVSADTATGQVTISNAAPSVGTVELLDSDAGSIQLTAASNTNLVTCNATLTDTNGYTDIDTANATFFHSTSSHGGADDKNAHYTNASCGLTGGSGTTVLATCSMNIEHEAINGTWTCNITAYDGTSEGSNLDTNTVDSLAALEVTETSINFGSLALDANSSSAQGIVIGNEGNIQLDSRFSGDDYSCTIGTVTVNNTRYSLSTGNYDSMSTDLTTSAVTQTGFNLGVEGVATSDDAPSNKSEYWTIKLPATGIGGSCTDTITVTAIAG